MKRKDGLTCTGTSKQTKERCGNPPIPGCKVCKFHGGAAPQVKAAGARRVLGALVGPALLQLRDIIEEEDTPPAVRLAAIRDVLDRTGYRPVQQLEVLTIGVVEAEIARLEAEQVE